MIYIYMNSLLEVKLKSVLSKVLNDYELMITSDKLKNSSYDIYFIEINNIHDIKEIEKIDQTFNPLIFVVGLRDYDLISSAVSKSINMYFDKSDIINDIYAKQEDIKKQIGKRFKCYFITTKYIKISLRISQIIYVESMNHEIIIHSTTGEIVERKALSQFIKDIDSANFVQTHKSYVINSWFISQIKNRQIILKNNHIIPIGKKYGNILVTL